MPNIALCWSAQVSGSSALCRLWTAQASHCSKPFPLIEHAYLNPWLQLHERQHVTRPLLTKFLAQRNDAT